MSYQKDIPTDKDLVCNHCHKPFSITEDMEYRGIKHPTYCQDCWEEPVDSKRCRCGQIILTSAYERDLGCITPDLCEKCWEANEEADYRRKMCSRGLSEAFGPESLPSDAAW